VTGEVRRDGRNATERIAAMLDDSRFDPRLVFLNGIAVAGFNVVDLPDLAARLDRPVVVVARRRPGMPRIRRALLEKVPGGRRKWALIEKAGPMEPIEGVWVQRAGISRRDAAAALRRATRFGKVPEPLRVAHLVAGALGRGESRGRA